MKRRGEGSWLIPALSVLLACSLLAWPALAAAAGSGADTPGSGTADHADSGEGAESAQEDAAADAEGEEPEEEPEPTLEELRDELLAILGGGEEAAAIQADIDRLIALGDPNGTLRTYLEGMIQLRQLQYQLEQLQTALEGMETSDGDIGAIGAAVAAAENPDEMLRRIEEEISAPAARLIKDAGYDGTGDLAAMAAGALAYLDSGIAGADSADMAAILLFTQLQESGLLSETGLVTAADAVTGHFRNILSRAPALPAQTLEALEAASLAIAGRANRARAISPGNLAAAGGTLELTRPVFVYGDTVMIALEDAAAFLDGEAVEMEDSAAVAIQAPGAVLEMTRGSSDAYLNDRLLKMDQPVLYFDGTCYLPLDAALRCGGLERITVGGYELIYPAL